MSERNARLPTAISSQCILKLCRCPHQVHVNALQVFVYNLEIDISEAAADVTVRENDDSTSDITVAQHRLATKIDIAVEVEANSVAFGEYRPPRCS